MVGGFGLQSVPGHTMYSPALHTQTHRDTFIRSTMLTGCRRGGRGEAAERTDESACVFVSSEEIHWAAGSVLGRPGYICPVKGYSEQTVTPSLSPPLAPPPSPPFSPFFPSVSSEQQPVLCSDCWVWVLCLWMLALAVCHVLLILSPSVSSVNLLSAEKGFIWTHVCLLWWICHVLTDAVI